MKYDIVIWDIDGTLLDTSRGLVDAYHYAIRTLKLAHKSRNEICSYIGPTPQTIFAEKFGLDKSQAQHAADIFRERYKTHDLFKATVYDGIYDTMEYFQKNNIKQAIATNKRHDYATEICKYFKFDKFCFPILGTDNFNKLSKSDLIIQCLKILNLSDLSRAVMVGDTENDKNAANIAGIDFIGVDHGFGFKEFVYVQHIQNIKT